MKRGWIITFLILFILLIGVLAFLLMDYQRKLNDKEKDLELARTQSKESLEVSEKLANIAKRLDSGEIDADKAKKEMAKITGEELEEETTTTITASRTVPAGGESKMTSYETLKTAATSSKVIGMGTASSKLVAQKK